MNITTNDIIQELRNPDNFVEVEWNNPETVPAEDRERIRQEGEDYRMQATEEDVEELIDGILFADASDALQAASWFLDFSADHGVYQTISVTLKRK